MTAFFEKRPVDFNHIKQQSRVALAS
jgi:hypothetical protein